MNQLLLVRLVDFIPQVPDVHVDDVAGGLVVLTVEVLGNLRPRHDLPLPRGQVLEQHVLAEREVEVGPPLANASIEPFAPAEWVVWDLSDLVSAWQSGDLPNDGVLLELADWQEDFGVSGPSFPSSTFADPSMRPNLTVWYLAR